MSSEIPDLVIRPLSATDSLDDLTELLHRAYAVLADMGLKYVATYQDVDTTRRRVEKGRCFVAVIDDVIVGTIAYYGPDRTTGAPWGHGEGVAHVGQMGVGPSMQRQGIGKELIRHVEQIAREDGAVEIALDTAEPARHLIKWYKRLGYRFVKHVDWDMTNYRSVIMCKEL